MTHDANTQITEQAIERLRTWATSARMPEDEKNAEYWEWGNYDDAYRYGVEVGEDRAKQEALDLIAILTEKASA